MDKLTFSVATSKIPDDSNLRNETFTLGSQLKGTVRQGEEAWKQSLEATGHLTPVVRKLRAVGKSNGAFSLLRVEVPSPYNESSSLTQTFLQTPSRMYQVLLRFCADN